MAKYVVWIHENISRYQFMCVNVLLEWKFIWKFNIEMDISNRNNKVNFIIHDTLKGNYSGRSEFNSVILWLVFVLYIISDCIMLKWWEGGIMHTVHCTVIIWMNFLFDFCQKHIWVINNFLNTNWTGWSWYSRK